MGPVKGVISKVDRTISKQCRVRIIRPRADATVELPKKVELEGSTANSQCPYSEIKFMLIKASEEQRRSQVNLYQSVGTPFANVL